jgi:hypothetical protein
MAKIEYNPLVEKMRGTLRNLTFRQQNGQLIISKRRSAQTTPLTPDQEATQTRFSHAAEVCKVALQDPAQRAFYEPIAASRKQPLFSVLMADYLNTPAVDSVDSTAYHGHVADPITMAARDDIGLVGVVVEIKSAAGASLEHGPAVPIGNKWVYHATTVVPAGTSVTIYATATDHAGQTGQRGAIVTV